MFAVSNLLSRVFIGVIFALLVALSAGLGAASRDTAGAKAFVENGVSGPDDSFGSAASDSFGSAPGTSTFGSSGGSSSFGSAPTKKKGSSSISSKSTAMKKKTSSKKKTAQKSTAKKTAVKKHGHKKPATPVVIPPQEQPKATPAPEEQPVAQPEKEAPQEIEIAGKGDVPAPAEELPTTGPGQTLGLFTGVSLAGFTGHKLYLRRKS